MMLVLVDLVKNTNNATESNYYKTTKHQTDKKPTKAPMKRGNKTPIVFTKSCFDILQMFETYLRNKRKAKIIIEVDNLVML